jgi:hypothetical protein
MRVAMRCHALEWFGALFDDRGLDGHGELCGGRVRTIAAELCSTNVIQRKIHESIRSRALVSSILKPNIYR